MKFHGAYRLYDKPCILAVYGDDTMQKIIEQGTKEPTYFLWHNAWYAARLKTMLKMKYRFSQLNRKGVKPLNVSNASQEVKLRKLFNIPGFESITYVFTNEAEYITSSTTEIKYDAIYIARMLPFKRLELTAEIKQLYILTYAENADKWDLHERYPQLSHANFNPQWLSTEEKKSAIRESRVGLCLSAEEGAMLASLECLLCGLPIVSTKSKGGRDKYYDEEYSIIVEPNSRSVKEAVQELIDRNIDRAYIRKKTIEKLDKERDRYVDALCHYVKKDIGLQLDEEKIKKRLFSHQDFIPVEKLAEVI